MVSIEKTTFATFDGIQLNAKVYKSGNNSGSTPGVLIIEGSGKSGFTEEPEGSPFSELAKAIAEHGYTVLKYNKRGSGENSNNGSFWKSTFNSDNQDAQSALNFLKAFDGVDASRIFLIGHSFGGPQSLLLATKNDVSGVILLTSTIRPTEELLLEQNAIIMGLQGLPQVEIDNYVQGMKKDLDQIKLGAFECQFPKCSKIDGVPAYEDAIQVPWLYEVLNMNFAETAKSVQSPILFIFGSSDPVIPESDYIFAQETFKGLGSHIEIKMLPKLDHFMVENESKKDSLLYAARAQKEKRFKPISEAILLTILGWLKNDN
jgi:dipeptidyl aminopeptidase/acylaminoacyl peptidase